MKLPILKKLFKPKSSQKELIYSLEIDHHQVKSAIWTVTGNKPQILSFGPVITWDDSTQDSLNMACDRTVSEAAESWDKASDQKISKVIFGLPADWLDPDKILPQKRQLIKNLSQSLDLTAIGFVVTPEAVISHLKLTEKVQPTAIIVGVSPHFFDVSLVKLGKLIQTESVRRSNQPAQDVAEGLSRIPNVEMFPSRILLYDSKTQLEPVRQSLLNYPWQSHSSKLPFLHYPKIEILPPNFSLEAISVSGGGEVTRSQGMFISDPSESVIEPQTELSTRQSMEEPVIESIHESPTENKNSPSQYLSDEAEPESLGFVIEDSTPDLETTQPHSYAVPDNSQEQIIVPDQQHPLSAQAAKGVRKISLPKFSLFSWTSKKVVALTIPVVVLVGLFVAYWYLPTATVNITPQSQVLNHEFEITVDTSADSVDSTALTIPGKITEAEISKSETINTTTTKLVGDKATGSVDIINGTAVPKKFPIGTVISTTGGLRFLTSEEVEVASASGSADPNSYKPGKSTVKVVADQIGSDSNLTAGTQFKVGAFSSLDFIAKNEQAFSGGSSRQAKVVTREDQAKLRSQLTQSAKEAAKQELLNNVSTGQTMVEQSIQLTVVSEEFSKKVDEISDDLTLKQTAKATGLLISESDIDILAEKQVADKVPQGFEKKSQAERSYEIKAVGKDSAIVLVKYSAQLRSKIDTDQIKRDLLGKSKSVASEYLSSLSSVLQAEITYSPPLPDFLGGMPRVLENIKVVVPSSD